MEQIARVLDHRVNELFPGGAVQRAELRPGEDPGQLMVRVFIPATEDLAVWAEAHREQMEELRRELSLRLPSARLLEFTSEAADAPVISMPDDGSLAAEQLSSRDIVVKALALLRENYVFPELAAQAAAAVEVRLAAGEYDNLDEITLTELLTSHLQEITDDRHLRVRLGGVPAPGGAGQGAVPADPGTSGLTGGRPTDGAGRPGQGRACGPCGETAEDAPDRAAGQLRHPPGGAPGRQHRPPRPAPDAGAGDGRPRGHRRDGTRRRDLRPPH